MAKGGKGGNKSRKELVNNIDGTELRDGKHAVP